MACDMPSAAAVLSNSNRLKDDPNCRTERHEAEGWRDDAHLSGSGRPRPRERPRDQCEEKRKRENQPRTPAPGCPPWEFARLLGVTYACRAANARRPNDASRPDAPAD